jgi:probable phosphoglycerate mutase
VRLILIRHGQTSSNTSQLLDTGFPGAPLDAVGLTQAAALVETLADEPIETIMSSDFTRAQQTAAPLAQARGLDILSHPGLREVYAGDLDMSADWRPYVHLIQAWAQDPTIRMPGGETGVEFATRYDRAITELVAGGCGCAAVVSHGAALRTWLMYRVANLPQGNSDHWVLANTATVVLDNSTGEWQVVRWADRFMATDTASAPSQEPE